MSNEKYRKTVTMVVFLITFVALFGLLIMKADTFKYQEITAETISTPQKTTTTTILVPRGTLSLIGMWILCLILIVIGAIAFSAMPYLLLTDASKF